MRIRLSVFLLLLLSNLCFGQGTVNFLNGPETLISFGAPGQARLISDAPGSFYFGLFISSPGTRQFTFSGIYATNLGAAFPGQISGGNAIGVPGWPFTSAMSFFVAGWSSSLGHDWNQQWLNGKFGALGYFGISSVATGVSGGPDLPPWPPLPLFGGPTGIQTGFVLSPVPEPSVLSLEVAGALLLLARLYQRIGKQP